MRNAWPMRSVTLHTAVHSLPKPLPCSHGSPPLPRRSAPPGRPGAPRCVRRLRGCERRGSQRPPRAQQRTGGGQWRAVRPLVVLVRLLVRPCTARPARVPLHCAPRSFSAARSARRRCVPKTHVTAWARPHLHVCAHSDPLATSSRTHATGHPSALARVRIYHRDARLARRVPSSASAANEREPAPPRAARKRARKPRWQQKSCGYTPRSCGVSASARLPRVQMRARVGFTRSARGARRASSSGGLPQKTASACTRLPGRARWRLQRRRSGKG